jgi:hypothetical protein
MVSRSQAQTGPGGSGGSFLLPPPLRKEGWSFFCRPLPSVTEGEIEAQTSNTRGPGRRRPRLPEAKAVLVKGAPSRQQKPRRTAHAGRADMTNRRWRIRGGRRRVLLPVLRGAGSAVGAARILLRTVLLRRVPVRRVPVRRAPLRIWLLLPIRSVLHSRGRNAKQRRKRRKGTRVVPPLVRRRGCLPIRGAK